MKGQRESSGSSLNIICCWIRANQRVHLWGAAIIIRKNPVICGRRLRSFFRRHTLINFWKSKQMVNWLCRLFVYFYNFCIMFRKKVYKSQLTICLLFFSKWVCVHRLETTATEWNRFSRKLTSWSGDCSTGRLLESANLCLRRDHLLETLETTN